MSVALPAPGGSVGLKTFAVYGAGAAVGIMAMQNFGVKSLPEAAWNWSVGPISGLHLWFGVGAIVGAALAAKVADFAK